MSRHRATTVQHPPARVAVTRGGLVESEHLLDAVVLREGAIAETWGDPSVPRFLRSCLKPCQALPAARRGAAERFGLGPAQLAVMCSSHSGEPLHVELVRGILGRLGLDGSLLRCGAHLPTHEPSARALLASGGKAEGVHNNCSGKHSGMLAACLLAGWPVESYWRPDHPLQLEIRGLVEELSGEAPAGPGIDGCGVPTWALTLPGAARLFSGIGRPDHLGARPGAPRGRQRLDPALAAAAKLLADAIADEPLAFAGTGRMSVRLLRVFGRTMLLKGGAEGMWLMASRDRPWAAAIKSRCGATRPHAPFLLALLERHGLLEPGSHPELDDLRRPVVRNHAGELVGEVRLEGC